MSVSEAEAALVVALREAQAADPRPINGACNGCCRFCCEAMPFERERAEMAAVARDGHAAQVAQVVDLRRLLEHVVLELQVCANSDADTWASHRILANWCDRIAQDKTVVQHLAEYAARRTERGDPTTEELEQARAALGARRGIREALAEARALLLEAAEMLKGDALCAQASDLAYRCAAAGAAAK